MNLRKLIASPVIASLLAVILLLPTAAHAQPVEEQPSVLAMGADMLFVRPIMLGVTILGAAFWTVTLPFSALGGNAGSALETLVVGPAETTFIRCLGCTQPGYQDTKEY